MSGFVKELLTEWVNLLSKASVDHFTRTWRWKGGKRWPLYGRLEWSPAACKRLLMVLTPITLPVSLWKRRTELVEVRNRSLRCQSMIWWSSFAVVTRGLPGLGLSEVVPLAWNRSLSLMIVGCEQLNILDTLRAERPAWSMPIALSRSSLLNLGILKVM